MPNTIFSIRDTPKLTSKRLDALKNKLTKELPLKPNNKETREYLENCSLADVLFFYLHWRSRFIPARPRSVILTPNVTGDRRWKTLKPSIENLLTKIRVGESSDGHLSKRVHTHGYTPPRKNNQGQWDLWSDKDQVLNLTGFHHLHLNPPGDLPSDNMLFGQVTRDKFYAVGIFNHAVFNEPKTDLAFSDERSRMWAIHRQYMSIKQPGYALANRPVMASGHPMELVRWADFCYERIFTLDVHLDCPKFLGSLYGQLPEKNRQEWAIQGLDLGLYDSVNKKIFIVAKGPM